MKNKNKVISRIWTYVGKYKLLLVVVFICAIIGNSLAMLGPLLVGNAIDCMRGDVDFDKLKNIILLLIGIYFISALFQWLLSVVSTSVANRTIKDIRRDAFNKLSRLPLKYFDTTFHGDIISKITNDIDAISEGLFQGTTQIMSGIIIILGCFFFMITISVKITIVIVCLVPICYFIARLIAKGSSKMFKLQSKTTGELNGYAEEMISNLKVVKAFGYEEKSYEKFEGINNRLYECGQQAQWYSSMTNPTTRYVNNLGYVAVTVIGGTMAIAGGITTGNIASFLTYSNQFAKPINEITSIMTQIQSALASAGRIFELLDEQEEVSDEGKKSLPDNIKGEVQFINVSFSYKKENPLITNLNLQVNPGSMVAIVGPTGAGKSTLVNLLMRFYEVDSGKILIDGIDINDLDRNSLRSNFGMVLQDSWLFEGTIKENLGYGVDDISFEKIVEASKEAHAHSFIKRLKDGYDTIVEEDGRNLSQGQKQLLTIARAMLIDPPMLILDEATSSIDTHTEIRIQKAFESMMKGRTTFIIAHRLSTIVDADTILVMKDGNIIEQGNHKELLKKGGFYKVLYSSQFEKSN